MHFSQIYMEEEKKDFLSFTTFSLYNRIDPALWPEPLTKGQ